MKQDLSKTQARLKQDSSKTQARLKKESSRTSKTQARLKQDSKLGKRNAKTMCFIVFSCAMGSKMSVLTFLSSKHLINRG